MITKNGNKISNVLFLIYNNIHMYVFIYCMYNNYIYIYIEIYLEQNNIKQLRSTVEHG